MGRRFPGDARFNTISNGFVDVGQFAKSHARNETLAHFKCAQLAATAAGRGEANRDRQRSMEEAAQP